MGDKVVIDEQVFTNIADAIRDKNGTEETYKPREMAAAISDIETGGGGDEPEPTDGKTHIWIYIDPVTPANRLTFPLYFGQSKANGVTVDWGDGSATETFSGTSATVHNHTYATGGDYEITLEVTNGTLNLTGTSGSTGYAIYGLKASSNSYNRSRIKRVHIGDGVASIGFGVFYYCYALTSVTIPNGVTSIGGSTFSYCYSLTSVTIPNGVTVIDASAFSSCYGIAEYHLLPTTPPTLSNTNAFNGIATDCIIYVPVGSLEAYQTATNWSTYASHMQEEPA